MDTRRQRALSLALVAALTAPFSLAGSASLQNSNPDPERMLVERFKFSNDEVTRARAGQPIVKSLDANARDEFALVGAIRLDGDQKRLVDWIRNIEQFRHSAELGLTRAIGSPPAADAFADLILEAKDVEALSKCRAGHCDLRISDAAIAQFASDVTWTAADAASRASVITRQMLADMAQRYLQSGDGALSNNFGDLIRKATNFSEMTPDFSTYLERFPQSPLPGVEQRLYWTYLTEGQAPIISLHHMAVYQRADGGVIIADKTIYASRYFDVAAIVLSMQATSDGSGYYLVAGSRAKAAKLAGLGGRVVRSQVQKSAVATVEMYLEWVRDSLAAR